MKRFEFCLIACLALPALAGCRGPEETAVEYTDAPANEAMIRMVWDMQRHNAAAAQRIVYPYHFAQGDAVLNPLGRQHLLDLAEGYRTAFEGEDVLVMAQSGIPEPLYQARVQTVRDALKAAGIDPARLSIVQGLPLGEGVPTDRVFATLRDFPETAGPEPEIYVMPDEPMGGEFE